MQDISASRRLMSPYVPVRKAWKNILSAGKRLTSCRLRHQSKPSPILEIPTEILIAIFWSYREISTDVYRVDGKTMGFTIAHVCHRWREVVLDLPFLWTLAQGPPRAIEQIIKRSGSLPISVTIKETPSQPCLLEGTRAALLHTDRLEALTLVGPAFENALQDATSPAPMLDVLEIRISGAEDLPAITVPDTIFAGQVPSLRILRLSGVSINLLTSPLFPTHLKVLDLHGGPHLPMIPLATFITFLNQLPRLQILMVKDILSNPGTIRALSNSLTNVPHVSLDYLALLNIGTQWINNFHLLQTRLAVGTNTRVHLHANLNTVESIIYLPLLKFMPPLRPEATPVQVLMLTDLDFRRIYPGQSGEPEETRLDQTFR
ncbi:hypothetical protein EWM64_g3303 [Hericium alpestre]|uniref:Uncharacterized protein n=1 Tax=Hericium alpestre TaxID=135208 RepID=A0A4Z0A0V2_9AGAM|nr:hypothetical protein EWM64_g3303 [Hericium alpestre]